MGPSIRMPAGAAAILALALAAAPATAQNSQIRTVAEGAAGAPATLADLKAILGAWEAPNGSMGFSAPRAGQLVGHLVLYNDDGSIRIQEFWNFSPDGASVTLHQKHYAADLTEREAPGKWGDRKLAGVDAGHIYLNNLTFVTKGDAVDLLVAIPAANGQPARNLSANFHRVK